MEKEESSTMDYNDTQNTAIACATAAALNVQPRHQAQLDRELPLADYLRTPAIQAEYSKFYRNLPSSSSSDDSRGAERSDNTKMIDDILASENITVENVTINSIDNRNYEQETDVQSHVTNSPMVIMASDRDSDVHCNNEDLADSAEPEISEIEPGGANVVEATAERSTRDDGGLAMDSEVLRGMDRMVDFAEGKEHFSDGVRYAESGRMKEAVKEWKISKSYGYRKSNFNLGICYEQGRGVKLNLEEAIKCYRKASRNRDHARAMFNYAALSISHYAHRPVTTDNRDQDFMKCLEKAADLGLSEAQILLGEIYIEFDDVIFKQKAVELFSKAATEQQPMAEYYLGICHEQGYGVESKNDHTAFGFYQRAAHAGIPKAQHNIAVFYEHGRGGQTRDLRNAIHWYDKAAQQGIELSASEAARLHQMNPSPGPQVTATSTNPSDEITETEGTSFPFTAIQDVDPGYDGDDDI